MAFSVSAAQCSNDKTHSMITSAADGLFKRGISVEALLGALMDTTPQLEAHQPVLLFLPTLWDQLIHHAKQFAAAHPELDKGQVPPDRRQCNPRATSITLVQVFEDDRSKIWHPAMSAAAVLDPLKWRNNARSVSFVPLSIMPEAARAEIDEVCWFCRRSG
jgi:hypothetical protein